MSVNVVLSPVKEEFLPPFGADKVFLSVCPLAVLIYVNCMK